MCWMKPSGGQKEAEAAVADVQKFAPQLHREHLPGGSWLPQSRGTRALHCVTMRCDDPHISICHAMICWHGLTRADDEFCLRPASKMVQTFRPLGHRPRGARSAARGNSQLLQSRHGGQVHGCGRGPPLGPVSLVENCLSEARLESLRK